MLFEVAEMGLVDLAFEVLESESNEQTQEKQKELEEELCVKKVEGTKKHERKKRDEETVKSKITLQDIKKAQTFLKTNKFHEDFLVVLGMTPEEIEKYRLKK